MESGLLASGLKIAVGMREEESYILRLKILVVEMFCPAWR